jgi:hypothetical protein
MQKKDRATHCEGKIARARNNRIGLPVRAQGAYSHTKNKRLTTLLQRVQQIPTPVMRKVPIHRFSGAVENNSRHRKYCRIKTRRENMRKYMVTVLIVTMVCTLFAAQPVMAGSTWLKTRIMLHATDNDPLASGKAVYREKDLGFRRKLNVEVEDVLSASSVNVFVDGELVGSINLFAGAGELELDTKNSDEVPIILTGSSIKVRNASNNKVILKGRNH